MQATWNSPLTSRLLLDAGFGGVYYGWGSFERDPNPTKGLTRVVEQCAAGCAANGGIANLTYRSQNFNINNTGSFSWKANVAHVTGSRSLKVGYQGTWMVDNRTWKTNDTELEYRVSNGQPNQLTMTLNPYQNDGRAGWHAGFAQGQWTLGRASLQGAVRYDHAASWFPEQTLGPSKYFPSQIVFPATKGVDAYNDITPRLGMAYDIFGNGRTAFKMNFGRYLEGVGVSTNYANSNPTLRIPTSTGPFGVQGVNRAWVDADADWVPDCNLNVLTAQGPTTARHGDGGQDFCGAVSNARWGQNVLTNQYDPNLLKGWGVRPSDWNFGASVQQQILTRMSVEFAYHRRSFRGFTVQDNTLVSAAEYSEFSVSAPSDPRLPNGGGYVVSGIFDVAPGKFGQILNNVTDSSTFGDASQVFNGFDATINLRQGGLTLQGGTSTGQTTSEFCDVRRNLPELNLAVGAGLQTSAIGVGSPYCDVSSGFLTQFRGLASYVIPRIDAQISAVFQSKPGPAIVANWPVPTATAAATALGRPLAGGVPNITVNLIEPGTLYGDRVNLLDLRMAKNLRFGGRRLMLSVDMYNTLDSTAILTYNTAYAPPTAANPAGVFMQPLTVATPRMVRFSAEIDF